MYCSYIRYQNKGTHHREQQVERADRDAPPRNRPQSTNGNANPTTGNNRNTAGIFRQREGGGAKDGDEFSRYCVTESMHCNTSNAVFIDEIFGSDVGLVIWDSRFHVQT